MFNNQQLKQISQMIEAAIEVALGEERRRLANIINTCQIHSSPDDESKSADSVSATLTQLAHDILYK